MRSLVVGDIHGCIDEFMEMLDRGGLSPEDQILTVGDIVDRGPASPQVLEFFRTSSNARSLLGNHELKHCLLLKGRARPALSQVVTRAQFGEKAYPGAVAFMETLPPFLQLPEADLVHAFLEPGIRLEDQRIAVLAGTMRGERYLDGVCARPWYEMYEGEKPLIVGHHDYQGNGRPFIYKDRVFCIDTACCHGKALTGLVLPGFRLISVKSRRDYWRELRKGFTGGIHDPGSPRQ
jgi:serine/threonine protein phosphatase 1